MFSMKHAYRMPTGCTHILQQQWVKSLIEGGNYVRAENE